MDTTLCEQLDYLGLKHLKESWDEVLNTAQNGKPSYYRFLCDIIKNETERKNERRRLFRLHNAKIPEMLVIETFPFERQPKLQKKKVMHEYDSLSFINENKVLLFNGPTEPVT